MTPRGDEEQAIYVISVAAELAGVHPQTLRVYERKGLLQPERTSGNTRRYSNQDIERLRKIQELTQEGLNLAGVEKVMELEEHLAAMERRYERALAELDRMQAQMNELLGARNAMSLVPLRDVRRVRRALKSDAIDQAGRRRSIVAPPVGGTEPQER